MATSVKRAVADRALGPVDHETASQRLSIDLARKAYFPDVNLGVEYIDTAGARMPGMDDSGKDPVMAMVSVNIPLWVEKYAAGVREAEARHWAALRTRTDRENALSGEVKMVLYRYRDAQRKINLYRDTLVPKALESLKATETAFRTGKVTFIDLVDAQRILLEFGLAAERALADQGRQLAQLEMLIGREVPRAAAAPPPDDAGAPTKNKVTEGDVP